MARNENRPPTGMHTVQVPMSNGKTVEVYTATAKKLNVWVVLLIGLATLASLVFTATKFGVQSTIREQILIESKPPRGIIHATVHDCVEEHTDEVEKKVGEDMKEIKAGVTDMRIQMGKIETNVENIKETVENIKRNGGG